MSTVSTSSPFKLRRKSHNPSIELAPLIDVMMFLLAFFIYSVMMMERVDLVPMELTTYQSGKAAKPAPAATISIDLDGNLYLDRVPVALDELTSRLESARTAAPDLVVYLALADGSAKVDRSALFLDIWDRLQPAKFNVNVVGHRRRGPVIRDEPVKPSTPAATGPTVPNLPTIAPPPVGVSSPNSTAENATSVAAD
jgi:biopolymer transport protein ExbD